MNHTTSYSQEGRFQPGRISKVNSQGTMPTISGGPGKIQW